MAKNVLNTDLQTCSLSPRTGFYRDGCCNTGAEDQGLHIVCIEATEKFLEFSKARGNDLSTPNPLYDFPGLKEGDRWCVYAYCAGRKRSRPTWRHESSWKGLTCRRLSSLSLSSCKIMPWNRRRCRPEQASITPTLLLREPRARFRQIGERGINSQLTPELRAWIAERNR